jgi:hypothetical protein
MSSSNQPPFILRNSLLLLMWISKFFHFTCKVGLIDKISSGFDFFVEVLLTHVFLQSLSRESNKEGQLATLNFNGLVYFQTTQL